MSSVWIGLALALIASLGLNVGFLMQGIGSADAPLLRLRHPVGSLLGLLRSRLWTGGILLSSAGWGLQIVAFSLAPLSLVQAFGAGGLALLVPLQALLFRRSTPRSEALAVCLIALALVLLAIGLGDPGARRDFTDAALIAYLIPVAALAGVLAAGGLRGVPRALGVAGGLLYGLSDVTTKAATGVARDGASALFTPWPGLTLVILTLASTVVGFLLFQRGLQSDRAIPVIALMSAASVVVATIGGVLVFGDPLGTSWVYVLLHLAAFGLVAYASWVLGPTADRGTAHRSELGAARPAG